MTWARSFKAVCDRCGFFGYDEEMIYDPNEGRLLHKTPCYDGIYSNTNINPRNKPPPMPLDDPRPVQRARPDINHVSTVPTIASIVSSANGR